MNLDERIKSFALLGETLRNALIDSEMKGSGARQFSTQLRKLINDQYLLNPWFTPENVRKAVHEIAKQLTEENLKKWTSSYPELNNYKYPFRVGVIMAGNVPLAGFHDFLSVLISGNSLVAKTSSKDTELIIFIRDVLCSVNNDFKDRIEFTQGALSDFKAIIATGSDNTSRYFQYYFGRYPNIIRKNRNSVAIIEGDVTDSELKALGTDIFSYFGMGCRNVSKIYVPKSCIISSLPETWSSFKGVIRNSKYANNYDFNKAVYLVNKEVFFDSGYLLLKEDRRISSPVAVLFYEYYDSLDAVIQQTEKLNEKLQCIIGRNFIPFGKAQSPYLWDYADGIDTLEFLLKKI